MLRGGFIAAGAAKVGLDVQFIRYRADESVIGSLRSLWISHGGRRSLRGSGAVELRGLTLLE